MVWLLVRRIHRSRRTTVHYSSRNHGNELPDDKQPNMEEL
jgi:hypothetical protein